jgi:acyl-coenzyme A synthetase/AMP-(fatty) acid ligase
MSLSTRTLLSPELRTKLALDHEVGGGNLLRKAIEFNPNADVAFIRSGRPLVNTAAVEQTDFSLLDIDQLAQSWSVWYLSKGIGPRDRVAILIEDTFAYSIHFYALSQIGAIPVLINSKVPREAALALCRRTGAVGLYIDRVRQARIGADLAMLDDLRWTQLAEELPAPPAAVLPDEARFRHNAEDPVVILHSSGTTGLPKPVVHTHATILAGPRYRLTHFVESPESLMMAAQPQSHVGSIGYATYAILAGTPMIALFDPSGPEMVAAIREHRPTMVLAFAHAYSDLAAIDTPEGALDSVVGWISMADAVHEAHIKEILGRRSKELSQQAVHYDRFGSSELGWGLMVQQHTLSSDRSDRRMGKPDPLAEFAVLRKDGTKAAAHEYGLIAVKSPSVTVGYWNDSDTTYRSKLSGYWLSGDVGYQDEDGNFFQVDRAVDVIETLAGTGYSVLMEEILLADVPGVLDCAVIAGRLGSRTVPVAVVTLNSDHADPEAVLTVANKALRAAGNPELAVLEVARSDEDLPFGVTGKVLKRQLRDKYSALDIYLRQADGKVLATAVDHLDSERNPDGWQ